MMMAPPSSHESLTSVIGELSRILTQWNPGPPLILLMQDARMAVGPRLFEEYTDKNHFIYLDPTAPEVLAPLSFC
jgi:hypothetical protein